MKRKEFISTCGKTCLVVLGGLTFLEGCTSPQYITAEISGSDMVIPLNSFEINKNGAVTFRKYVIAHHDKLQYPISVFRVAPDQYKALLMKCTHQGTELQVFGDRLQCPAHGSEFTSSGAVKNGPAETPLRTFPVRSENGSIKINLA